MIPEKDRIEACADEAAKAFRAAQAQDDADRVDPRY